MVSKRKQPTMALMQQDISVDEDSTPTPADGRRRSGRKAQKTDNSLYPDSAAPDKENTPSGPGRPQAKKAKVGGRKAVDVAVKDLKRMEAHFRENAEHDKSIIGSSAVIPKSRSDLDDAFMPKPSKGSPETMPSSKNEKKSKESMSADEARIKLSSGGAAVKEEQPDPEREEPTEDVDVEVLKLEGARPPPVHSDHLPLPWKGRLGYACLNTYLRLSNPPVFSSRTCRIASIIEHRHPLQDTSQPEHATKNRPDKEKPADMARGQRFVEDLGLANARDIVKMIRWNDKYGIKFMRLSSEMFPFASHEEYGYKLAPFASEVLAEAGRVAGELGHRLTTHPGQFTQLGSPRKEVVRNAVRDLIYHDELLSLLRLPEQQNKDAVMILHMGGVFGDKAATLDRFRENYAQLSPSIKARLVLENDDVSWSVHDLLPICEELNIPMVLDFHHHNIIFDSNHVREGTKDIVDVFPRIKATWDRKGITQKMHYSEPCPDAITGRQRRKHSPRVMTLPPCADTMDLMIEAKDKEQAVFNLMRNYRLPGWDSFNDVVPYLRDDENRPPPKIPKKKIKKTSGKKKTEDDDGDMEMPDDEPTLVVIPDEEVGMGGPNNRVYWPVGMEEWLKPKKREVKPKRKAGTEEDGA